jgi:hypothetical protein
MRQAQKRAGKDGTRRPVQLYPIICIVCGRTFTPRKVNAKTCSNKCRVQQQDFTRRAHHW